MRSSDFPLYDPAYDHGSCGLGFVAHVDGHASHDIVQHGLDVLASLAHRGATGSDPDTGDGAGLLVQIPDAFFRRECPTLGIELPPPGHYAVGMLFISPDPAIQSACRRDLERIVAEEGQRVLGWRDVPVELRAVGKAACSVAPVIQQVFIDGTRGDGPAFARKLYVIRRRLHRMVEERYGGSDNCYVVSLSASTLVYKGLMTGPQLPAFYPDLCDASFASALALVHSRFSTNTLGSWQLAHPYRYVAHNGEINTLRGNVNWMRARESRISSDLFGSDIDRLRPVFEPRVSDSASFDNALELLVLAGRPLPHAVMTMIPEAWENAGDMDESRRSFYQYHSSLMEPWDGPAAIAFTDGKLIGATLDRNGLRPARYFVTRTGLVVLASEAGVLPVPEEDVITRHRLEPGRMLVVDTERHALLSDDEVKRPIIRRRPYGQWVSAGTVHLDDLPVAPRSGRSEAMPLGALQQIHGYSYEDLKLILSPMATQGKEPSGSMGTDTPLAVLSERPQLLFSYFHQLFAQVTNPPIDPLREGLVMSLQMSLGPEENLLDESPRHCRRVLLDHPILTPEELDRLRSLRQEPFHSMTLSTLWPVANGPRGLETAVERLCQEAEQAVKNGATILVLSDRGIDADQAPIPSLLATAAVHHHLVRQGTRTRIGLVVETGEAREIHHFALLIGYGAVGICPYLALETISSLAASGALEGVSRERAVENYIKAVQAGLLKVISKMGISTLLSYCGAQIFEAIGLDASCVERYFTGTASRLGGIGMDGIARETLQRHQQAVEALRAGRLILDAGGAYQLRPDGEYHQWNPASIVSLQRAVRTENFSSFQEFTAHFDRTSSQLATLRGLFDLKPNPIPLDQVEPATEIVKRFSTGAMSFGSLSREAHETLAVAMNRIGGKSNSGEGGEEAERALPDPGGDSRRSAIKQVASARFGVTAQYLVSADVLQIKMAQGAKPGEGGQIPADKVSEDIARVRHATPGVALISPPPHHDIYSIEDLAQLIYDLKVINPRAQISVKLVAEVGVGTIAAGVVKAKTDHITIAGHDGGTGASPLSSIKYAGLPWELGLAETQQVLVANGLRGRVRVQVDGHLKTGRDVVIAALLGAEEFAFSTAPLVATGCIMMRACHLNTCPVGIATQNPDLRERFAGKPEHVINYFFFLAEEVRRLMAELGFRRFDDMVGRSDRLTRRNAPHWKARSLDLSPILSAVPVPRDAAIRQVEAQVHDIARTLERDLLHRCRPTIEHGLPVALGDAFAPLPIHNTDRAVGAALSGEIARRYGDAGLPDDTIRLTFRGAAGQSFGAWGARGLTMVLHGETNDFAGKGLSGARLVVTPPAGAGYDPERSVVTGNVALYGATGGEAYFHGLAGERFAVRNSGAHAVVEGVGDHACEYMTGGVVVVLGPTGRNFAAGMTGGMGFVLDTWGRFHESCNMDSVGLEPLTDPEDITLLRHLIQQHLAYTGSTIARRVLLYWPEYVSRFLKVMPHDLKRMLEQQASLQLAEQVG